MPNTPLDPLRAGAVVLAVLIIVALLFLSRLLKERGGVDEVRGSLRPEIDYNLRLLREYWNGLKPRESREDEVHSLQKRLYAREFALTPLPSFSRQAYERALASIKTSPEAKRFIPVTNLYADLRLLESLQAELRAALAAGEAERRTRAGETAPNAEAKREYDDFLRIAGRTWDEAWHRIERLLAQGNPLAND